MQYNLGLGVRFQTVLVTCSQNAVHSLKDDYFAAFDFCGKQGGGGGGIVDMYMVSLLEGNICIDYIVQSFCAKRNNFLFPFQTPKAVNY